MINFAIGIEKLWIMKKINILVVFLALFSSVSGQVSRKMTTTGVDTTAEYRSFGNKIDLHGSISNEEMDE